MVENIGVKKKEKKKRDLRKSALTAMQGVDLSR
jgi:hypothetical protein